MAVDARAILSTFSLDRLKELAVEHQVTTDGCTSKSEHVDRLLSSESIAKVLETAAFRVRPILKAKSNEALQTLAAEHGVDVAGLVEKADFIDRIAANPVASRILEATPEPEKVEVEAEEEPDPQAPVAAPVAEARPEPEKAVAVPEEKPDSKELVAVPVADVKPEPESAPAEPKAVPKPEAVATVAKPEPTVPNLSQTGSDDFLLQGKNIDADFGLAEDILDQARMRFEERAFDRVLELAHESLLLVHGTLDAFERSAWAYGILASQKLIEESGRVGRDVDLAAALLRDARVLYVSGNLAANRDLLIQLHAATKALYSEEVQRLRGAIHAAEDRIQQAGHVGADVAAAEEALTRARDAMQRAEHSKAVELLAETERLATDAVDARVKEIAGAIPATARLIEESQHVGAEVGDAARLLEKAKVAIERKEYVLAAELVQRAERSALQAQHYQIEKAMELRLRQIERAQGVLNRAVPILDEAASYGFEVEEVRRVLTDAHEVLDQGDYVNGTILARRVEELTLALVPRLVAERPKHGIAKPTAGRCTACESTEVVFLDDGWSQCSVCHTTWRWRVPSGLWERFRSLIRE